MGTFPSGAAILLIRKAVFRPFFYRYRCFSFSFPSALSSKTNLTHYQTLGVEKDASSEVIREAFIKLSKYYHPDINSEDPQNHDKFVKINEAYSVLSKPLSRRDYDSNLLSFRRRSPDISNQYSSDGGGRSDPYYHRRADYDPQFYANRDKSQDKNYEKQPYYGVDGVSKVSNRAIVYVCVSIILVGAAFHSFVVKKLSDIHIENLNDRDRKTHQVWLNANNPTYISEQVELMKMKIEEMEEKKKND